MSNLCIICLKETSDLKNLNELDENDVRIVVKLRKCVPQVEWKIDHSICLPCSERLEKVWTFYELCMKSYLQRKGGVDCSEIEGSTKECVYFNNRSCSEDETDNLNETNFVCFHCEQSFKQKSVLEEHMKSEHTKHVCKKVRKHYKCEICGKSYLSEGSLSKHKAICDQDKLVEDSQTNMCDMCGASFGNKYLLKRHIKNVHATEKKFKCELCERKFASPVYLNAHKRYHSGERKHICSFCGKGYITASDLYHHEKIHANKRAYQCQICPKAFNTSSDLHKHKICVHQDRAQWKYECTFCQRRFPLKTNLDTHTKTHTGERNFLCHLCDRKCINRSVLKRHIESHSVVKSFKCSVCMQGYKYQKSLDVHMVKVHGIGEAKVPERVKKFFCSVCPKSYFANNKLQKHIRSHTGERPFRCPACDKCFIDKSYIKQHLKTAHNVF